MDLKTSQNQYTISLDAIDLNFIPTISKYNGHKVTQIWTKKNLTRRDNEYYEFEIMDENEDDGKTTQNALTPCYICNTDIPKIFIRDHLNSNKHKIFKKIINASLDRMKKVVSNEIVHEGKREDESIYFCECCVAIVKTQEKNSHENSAKHRKSLAADKILNDFLDLYIDNKEFSEGTDKGSIIINCKNYNTLKNNSELSENNGNNTPYNKSTDQKIKESTYTNNSSQDQCVTLSKEKQTVALPVKNENLKCFPVKEGGQKKEEVPTLPCQVVLKRIGTHIKDNSFYCAICNINVPNHNYNIYTHITSAKHINNATKQAQEELIDVHYHMDLTKFPQLECFVCKKSLPLNNIHNVTAHTLGFSHQENYKLVLSENKLILRNGKYICNVCHVVIDPMHELVHCQTSSHLGKLSVCKNVKDANSSNISQDDYKIRRYLLKNDLKQQLCLVCNVKVPKDLNNVNSHLTGRVHNENYNTILRENKIRSQGNNLKCELCDVIVPTGGEIQHIQTATHRANAVGNGTKKTPSTSTSSTSISTEDNKLRTYLLKNVDSEKKLCLVCNIHVPDDASNIVSHLTERVHNEDYNTILRENKFRSLGNNFKCELCDVIVPTGGEIQHIQTVTHGAKVVVNVTKEAPSTLTSSTSISTDSDDELRTYLLKNVDSKKNLCLVCNSHVPNDAYNTVSHLTERVHNENYHTILRENKIHSQGNKYKCELCDVFVSTGGEIQHIQTATHRANAVRNGTKKAPSTSTSSTSISTEDNKLRTYLLKNVDSEKKLCLVCNIHVPNDASNIVSHLTERVHNEDYNTILRENKFRSLGNNFKCELCDVIVPTGGEIQHIQTATHGAKVVVNVTKEAPSTLTSSTSISTDSDDELRTYLLKNVDSKKNLCLVCNIHVQKNNNNIISHLSDAHHNKKYKKIIKKNEMYPQDDDYKCELCDVIVPTGSEIQHIMSERHKTGIAIKKQCVLC